MPDIVRYDPNTNYILDHLTNEFESQWEGVENVLVFSSDMDMISVRNLFSEVPRKYIIRDESSIREMTSLEKAVVDAAELTAAIASAKQGSKDLYDAVDTLGRAIRAMGKLFVDEVNTLRTADRNLSADIAAATSLANLQTRRAARPSLSDRTYAQARTAFRNLVDGE